MWTNRRGGGAPVRARHRRELEHYRLKSYRYVMSDGL